MARPASDILSSWKSQFDAQEELVKAEDAAKGNESFRSIERAPCLWTGVRGSNYNQRILATLPEGVITGILAPEPDNAFDPLAVAIYVQRLRIGYLSSGMAANYHTVFGMMRKLGHRLSIRVEISKTHYLEFIEGVDSEIERSSYEAHVCVPSLRRLDRFVPEKVIHASLMELWKQMPEDTRNQIIMDRYHLSQLTGQQVLDNRHLAPDYCFPTRFDINFRDAVFDRFLQEVRISNKKVSERNLVVRNNKIHRIHLAGKSNREIARIFGLQPGTISGIIRKIKSQNSEAIQ